MSIQSEKARRPRPFSIRRWFDMDGHVSEVARNLRLIDKRSRAHRQGVRKGCSSHAASTGTAPSPPGKLVCNRAELSRPCGRKPDAIPNGPVVFSRRVECYWPGEAVCARANQHAGRLRGEFAVVIGRTRKTFRRNARSNTARYTCVTTSARVISSSVTASGKRVIVPHVCAMDRRS